jgi:capsular polysaccharide biosynthesis protein
MEQQNREYNDEINLYDLWKVIAKRKMLIIWLFIVVVVSTAIGSFLMPDIYRGEACLLVIINSEIIKAKEITDFIGKIDREKQLSLVPKSYPNLTNIKLNAIKDSKNKIIVTIDARKIDDIPRALLEVVAYLNNIDIIKSQVSRDKAILLKQLAELSDLIKSSPDLLATYNKLFSAGKLTTVGFNPVEVNKKIIDIKVDLLAVEHQLSRLNNGGVEIATQPYISNKPISPKRLLNIVAAGIFSLVLGVFLAIFIEYIGNIKNKKS